jgi:hypothetical protein
MEHLVARSPIEQMIDAACGVPDGARFEKRDTITLSCPKCERTKTAARDKTDPPNTATVMLTCPACHDAGDFQDVTYYNSRGEQIDLAGNPSQ